MLGVAILCACAAWLSFAAETTKKKSDEEESSTKSRISKTASVSKSGTGKTGASVTTTSGKSTPSKSTSGKSDTSKTASSSKTGSSKSGSSGTSSTKTVASKSDSSKSKGATPSAPVNSAPGSTKKKSTVSTPSSTKKSGTSTPAVDKKVAAVSTPEKPAEDVKPKMSTPVEKPISTTGSEPAPKDVTTSNLASSRNMEGNEQHGEFDRPDAEEEAKAKAKSTPAAKSADRSTAVATTSSDMVGWELIRYQERDYVTASSIHKFYRFTNLETKGNSVWFRSSVLVMKATLGSQDLLINNIKFVLSDPVLELKGKPCFSRLDLCKLIDPVLRPSYIGSGSMFDTVILDPGHGGHDSGARGIYGYEKDFALKLAFAVKADLEKRGLKVVMTRSTDTFISLGNRVAYANKVPNSIYVSLHFNSGGSSATGIETFALTPQGASSAYGAASTDAYSFNGNQRDSENIALATAIHASVVHHFRFVDRGVKRARWYVLKGLERPGVLFEGGFVTNPNDAKFIAADNFRQELASTLGQAIMNYRRALQPRTGPTR
jgi:N-acetylmuramoyl-L-alanine amidase